MSGTIESSNQWELVSGAHQINIQQTWIWRAKLQSSASCTRTLIFFMSLSQRTYPPHQFAPNVSSKSEQLYWLMHQSICMISQLQEIFEGVTRELDVIMQEFSEKIRKIKDEIKTHSEEKKKNLLHVLDEFQRENKIVGFKDQSDSYDMLCSYIKDTGARDRLKDYVEEINSYTSDEYSDDLEQHIARMREFVKGLSEFRFDDSRTGVIQKRRASANASTAGVSTADRLHAAQDTDKSGGSSDMKHTGSQDYLRKTKSPATQSAVDGKKAKRAGH
eukprot:TRINITY_DN3220_c0_g1_i8.p1 TRINITY_DN3220_c0_g1~~TRINITY_DN3220_c0_g1_i8.p1  ORF type:complete len:275 (-),score=11.34 TRINITY_DN3220_c0_g1_i8:90-914(-)